MKDINIELFKRYKPEKKIEIIELLTAKEVMKVKESTSVRIIKETGTFLYGSKRNKHLNIARERRRSNSWNSTFEGIEYNKGKLYVELYLQYENTDTSIYEDWNKFFLPGDYNGQYQGDDMMGNPRTYYFTYTEIQKVRCIKSILYEYVYRKYADKLKDATN